MSSLALMRWLESAPDRYDAGMRWITLGRAPLLQAAAAEAAAPEPGLDVLEIGCGTGAVTERLVARGARVVAVDQDPAMLEQAHARLADAPPGVVTWLEQTASEIDALGEASFDAVVSSFALCEMSASERRFVLARARERLRPGGLLVVADEVVPRRLLARLAVRAARLPQAALAWLVAGSVSSAIPDLAAEVRAAGLDVVRERTWLAGSFALVIAERSA